MRQVKNYRSRTQYEADKIIMRGNGWRALHHNAPFSIEYIKGNEPENIVPPKTDMTRTAFINKLAENSDVNLI